MAHKIIRLPICLFSICLYSLLVGAQSTDKVKEIKFIPKEEGISFLAIGRPSALKIRGKAQGPEGKLMRSEKGFTGELSVLVSAFDTGIELRNRHMKEKYLHSDKFPKAVLRFLDIKVDGFSEEKFTVEDLEIPGELTLHGITKPVKIRAQIVRDGTHLAVKAHFEFKISDFAIETPGYMGIKVADDVKVDVETEASIL